MGAKPISSQMLKTAGIALTAVKAEPRVILGNVNSFLI
jgi:hypothetical protein